MPRGNDTISSLVRCPLPSGSTESARTLGRVLAPYEPPVNVKADTGGFFVRISRDVAATSGTQIAGAAPVTSPQSRSVAPRQGRAVASMSNHCKQTTASRRGEVQIPAGRGRFGAGWEVLSTGSRAEILRPRGCHPQPKYPSVNNGEKGLRGIDRQRPTDVSDIPHRTLKTDN